MVRTLLSSFWPPLAYIFAVPAMCLAAVLAAGVFGRYTMVHHLTQEDLEGLHLG